MDFGFIITRHVTNKETNYYWNECISLIRYSYPYKKIVVIDDNSNYEFVHAFANYKNVVYVQSEYEGRGELLPYIYLLRNEYFKYAVIIHDSSFFQTRIRFETLKNISVIPLWHFNSYEDPDVSINLVVEKIIKYLNNNSRIRDYIKDAYNEKDNTVIFSIKNVNNKKWQGCFGGQCFISLDTLKSIQNKYNIEKLVEIVKNRTDRCAFERVLGIIFAIENPKLLKNPSLLGNIFSYCKWGYTFKEYNNVKHILKKSFKLPIIKVWTGR